MSRKLSHILTGLLFAVSSAVAQSGHESITISEPNSPIGVSSVECTSALVLPLRINCGGPAVCIGQRSLEESTASDSVCYLADTRYTSQTGYGFVGGESFTPHPYLSLGGTETPTPYLSERVGSFSYRADLPPGEYLVTLRFAAMLYHGRTLGIFDLISSASWIEEDMDLMTRAPRCYAQDVRRLLQTDGSPLVIGLEPSVGQAEIAAIEIHPLPTGLPPCSPIEDL
ncbi:malectin domain-containing carbohydrate-binding protein, partial [Candidatus Eisenbacteria bacterium]